MALVSDEAASLCNVRAIALTMVLLGATYAAVLIVIELRNPTVFAWRNLIWAATACLSFSLLSYMFRYIRWRWLLRRYGYPTPWGESLLGYLAGFALTASPGKVGELIRIRYFARMDVPAARVIATFILERVLDLIALLLLSTLAIGLLPGLGIALAFVTLLLASLVCLSCWRRPLLTVVSVARQRRLRGFVRVTYTLHAGLAALRNFRNPAELLIALLLGLTAWVVQVAGLLVLLSAFGIDLPLRGALAVQPLAMLLGAASLLPGGIGSTEAAMMLLIGPFANDLERTALVVAGMRLCTLWFAVALGLTSMLILEWRGAAREERR